MAVRRFIVLAALALIACDRVGAPADKSAPGPQLEAPAPEAEAMRTFAASSDASRAATGQISVAMASRMPDAQHAGDAPQDTLSLHGANGLQVEGDLTNAMSPATLVNGQTLRALLAIPVEESRVMVYRVTSETKPESGHGLCGTDTAAYVVIWEPAAQGEPVLKALGVMAAAPGAAGARQCQLLEYRRS